MASGFQQRELQFPAKPQPVTPTGRKFCLVEAAMGEAELGTPEQVLLESTEHQDGSTQGVQGGVCL